MIPIKDASLIARCDDSAIRREWRSRLADHDGEGPDDGGIARWLRLTDGLGLDRDYVASQAAAPEGFRLRAGLLQRPCAHARAAAAGAGGAGIQMQRAVGNVR